MRILYFINGFDPGGAEHGLLTLVKSGFFEGHDLHVMGICRGRGGLADALLASLGETRVEIVDDREELTLAACAAGAIALARKIRSFRPDVVILSLKQANVVGRLVLQMFRAPRCVSFEHISRYRARRLEGVYGWLLTTLSNRVDEVWSDCQETLEATRPYFKRVGRREMVVPLFLVNEGDRAKESYWARDRVEIVGAGRLVGRKNFDKLILAIKAVHDAGRPVHLTIFGDGPEQKKLERLVSENELEMQVTLAGYRPKWFEEAAAGDIFVNASDTEGFCIVVAEAMSVGLPVIATDVGGIREYGRDQENMLKVGNSNIDTLVSAIERLVEDRVLRNTLGRQARADMRRQYSGEGIAARGREVLS